MAAGRIIVAPFFPVRDRQNDLVSEARLYVWANNTTNLVTVYSNQALTIPLTNPVVANSSGQFPAVWIEGGTYDAPVGYSVQITDEDGGSVGNPSTFNNFYPSLDYDQASVALVDASAVVASDAAAEAVDALAQITAIANAAPQSPAVFTKEDKANKASVIGRPTTDLAYPSSKAVYEFVLSVSDVLDIRDYAPVGSIGYIDPSSAITYAVRESSPNITNALILAISAAVARFTSSGRFQRVQIGAGLYTLNTDAIVIPSGVYVDGQGDGVTSASTHIRRKATTGNTFGIGVSGGGNSVFNAGLSNLRIYQDHGGDGMYGYENPSAALFLNKATSGTHIYCYRPRETMIYNVTTYGGSIGLGIFGGQDGCFDNLDINGIWDLDDARRQEGVAGIAVSGTGSDIPTWHRYGNIRVGGQVTVPATLTYPGGNTKSSVKNIGFLYGVDINCCEEIYFDTLNVSACAKSDIRLLSASTRIIQGLQINGTLSPCGTTAGDAYIKIENEDASGFVSSVIFNGEMLGQTNGYIGVSDFGNTSTNNSVASIVINGKMSSFVGNAVRLTNAGHVTINADIFDCNVGNTGGIGVVTPAAFYTGDDAALCLFGANVTYNVSGVLGGSLAGKKTGHFCIDGVRFQGPRSVSGVVTASNGGLAGSLHVANGKILDRLLDDGSIEIRGSGSFTYDIKTNAKTILINSALVSTLTITLPTSGVPDGFEIRIVRTTGASGAFNVVAGALTLSSAATYGVIKYYDGANFIPVEKGVTV